VALWHTVQQHTKERDRERDREKKMCSLSLSRKCALCISLSLSLGSVWDPETSRERVGDWGGPATVWSLLCVAETRATRPKGEWGYSTRRQCWATSAQRRCHPEEALYLPTFSHLFDCQQTSLSLSLSLSLPPDRHSLHMGCLPINPPPILLAFGL
jgi:hypothetical protein